MIRLEQITEKTFFKVIDLKVKKEQESFVAENIMSLAQAWLYYDKARPFAIVNDDVVVGFLMLEWDVESKTASLWRFMIGENHQKKGFGTAALKEAIKLVRESNLFTKMALSVVKDNLDTLRYYQSFGFLETGEIVDDEIVMAMDL
ncbi:GNAT family N-acetyltransferase [Acholeplasma equirhinis]|uniref:GNAT family N-acetyltransferase n=1 Tax=Acholeplasma equirhinis TaxID=555393 RepID=UPI00197ACCDB|nr:GNAT family N-acetyltransferase [Acholeplasma equirhinis]MBN3489886.1 GNAT family N-acetyltransferase [Acholeplasma equirhinis]